MPLPLVIEAPVVLAALKFALLYQQVAASLVVVVIVAVPVLVVDEVPEIEIVVIVGAPVSTLIV